MHTPLCRHAVGEPVELAAQAVKVGLYEIGFSDHNPMPEDDFDNWRMKAAELDEYVAKVGEARRAYPALAIKLALEVDYIPGRADWIRELAARHPWDYLIGSVHYISDSWDIDNPSRISEWKSRDPLPTFTAYLTHMSVLTPEREQEIDARIQSVLDDAVRFAEDSPDPSPEKAVTDLYA